jgi:hypothetical protein
MRLVLSSDVVAAAPIDGADQNPRNSARTAEWIGQSRRLDSEFQDIDVGWPI